MLYQCETDLDLPEAKRTQANKYKMWWLEAQRELVRANKGLRRLSSKVKRLESRKISGLFADFFLKKHETIL